MQFLKLTSDGSERKIMLQLHSKVVGDFAKATKKISKRSAGGPSGNPGVHTWVLTADCEPFEQNRDTSAQWCASTLAKEGSFNWSLFGAIEGIRDPQTNKIQIWDGLGRLALAQFSSIPEIPVIIHDALPEEAGKFFIKKQKARNRTLNPEAHFVSYCSALPSGVVLSPKEDNEVKKELAALLAIGARVESGVNNYYPLNVPTLTHPKISISALRRALKISHGSFNELKLARDAIVGAYPNQEIGKELFEAMTLIFSACPDSGKNGTYKSICDFLISMNNTPQKRLSGTFKKLGGNQHNDEARSVALGFWQMWNDSDIPTLHNKQTLREIHIKEFTR